MSSRRRSNLRARAPLAGFVTLVAVAGCGLATEGNLVDNGGSRPDASFDSTTQWPSSDASKGDGAEDASLDVAADAPHDGPKDVGADVTCWAGMKACGAKCVPTNDPDHGCDGPSCTACSVAHATAVCAAGSCAFGACKAGFANCDGQAANGCEVTLGSDLANCGACGQGCSFAHATATCAGGACALGACEPGYGDCDGDPSNGCEALLTADPQHCGTCKIVCSGVGGSPVCNSGTCGVSSCNAGLANCDANPADCETNVQTSVTNCGFCGNACKFTNGTAACTGGSCQLSSCKSGYGNCDGNATNGCETGVATNPANCGGCGKPCPARPNGASTCTGGQCGIACASGFGDCNAQLADGCETNLGTNPQHCGSCDGACPVPAHATAKCAGGLCGFDCQTGFADCNGNPADGCEVNLATDPQHCGSCAKSCPPAANATGACAASVCTFACTGSYGNCDGIASNGCEADTSSDAANCGACATLCTVANGSAGCSSSACTVAGCTGTFRNCDGKVGNGCEADTSSDPTNCGSCGKACAAQNATMTCVASACAIGACNSSYADCDKNPSNGCEANLTDDPKNCGACNAVCAAPNVTTAACTSSGCAVGVCAPGWADCDGSFSDGCEVDTRSDSSNCGKCENRCDDGGTCDNGVCN